MISQQSFTGSLDPMPDAIKRVCCVCCPFFERSAESVRSHTALQLLSIAIHNLRTNIHSASLGDSQFLGNSRFTSDMLGPCPGDAAWLPARGANGSFDMGKSGCTRLLSTRVGRCISDSLILAPASWNMSGCFLLGGRRRIQAGCESPAGSTCSCAHVGCRSIRVFFAQGRWGIAPLGRPSVRAATLPINEPQLADPPPDPADPVTHLGVACRSFFFGSGSVVDRLTGCRLTGTSVTRVGLRCRSSPLSPAEHQRDFVLR